MQTSHKICMDEKRTFHSVCSKGYESIFIQVNQKVSTAPTDYSSLILNAQWDNFSVAERSLLKANNLHGAMVQLFLLINDNELHRLMYVCITLTKLTFVESICIFSLLKFLPSSRHFRCVPCEILRNFN